MTTVLRQTFHRVRGSLVPAWCQRIGVATLRADLMAGLLGAVLVLPQGVAFATLAGLPPEYGIYTSVVPCIVAALFGSSWHVMSGPTNANSLALFAMLGPLAVPGSADYVGLAVVVAILVGAMQLLIGLLRLGSVANFISPSVLLGFTGGAAALIGLYGLKDFFGLSVPTGTSAFGVVVHLLRHLDAVSPAALAVGVTTIVVTVLARRISARLPFMLIGLLGGYCAALLVAMPALGGHRADVVGAIPSALPPFHVPHVSWQALPELLGISAALTIVALGQSISIAKAVAMRSGQHIDANREFVGQGLSNLAGGFFSSYVSCGSLGRSMPNFEAGAQTPLASVFSAVLLVVLVAFSAPLLAQLPLAAIAAMLLLVSASLINAGKLRQLARHSRSEFVIAICTFAATLVLRLELAVLLGSMLSLVAYLYRTSRPAIRSLVPDRNDPARPFTPIDALEDTQPECPQLKLVRVEGAVYFGAVQYVTDRLQAMRCRNPAQKHLLAMVRSMNFIDLAGAELWEHELADRRAAGGDVYFHRPRQDVCKVWDRTGFTDRIGTGNIFRNKDEALRAVLSRLDPQVCETCTVRIFKECEERNGR
ncbi:SulP family inorganic anion transporter [Cupriavidus sp. amp6]|uniref:SulP family inorganic anion transporter n=1 Tax=Cupriavidus sp. amp6 TaxID=388051 RepID=UPI000A023062|nr:SulP family inorganic anion transporter [Cupriavidus sp. amp6]